ncbi:MAG: hypothetical protein MI741_10645 [Rhodospirillales bacterium]|nr:hypothetical protein [Rhodospirillales bacterium]
MIVKLGQENLKAGDLESCLGRMSTLLWRIEVPKSRIEVLSRHACDRLSVDVIQLLKNPDFRKQFVHADDLDRLNDVMHGARRGEGGSAVFRVPGVNGATAWLKLAGYVDPARPDYVWGHLIDITEVIDDLCDKVPQPTEPSKPSRRKRTAPAVEGAFDPQAIDEERIESVLEFLFEHQVGPAFEGILFSDIFKRKKKVVVYGHGLPFEGMEQGKVFPYEGTIAETILNLDLDYLVVDDTLDSIKAIDWALFLPAGIRSYFAMPFFRGKTLHSVLILCSTSPNGFPEDRIGEFEPLFAPFEKGVNRWRRAVNKR